MNCVRFDAQKELNTTIDGLIISSESIKDFSVKKIIPYCKNETCIFIEHIHQTKKK